VKTTLLSVIRLFVLPLFPCLTHALGSDMVVQTSIGFSQLDGSASDEDGIPDGVLTLSSLTVTAQGRLIIDVPSAMIKASGPVTFLGSGYLGSDPANRPTIGPIVTIASESSISLAGNSSLDADAMTSGGQFQLCALGAITVGGNARIRAHGLGGVGGLIRIQAGPEDGRIQIDGSALLSAGGPGGGGQLLICATEDVLFAGNAALRVDGQSGGPGGSVEIQAGRNIVVSGQIFSIQANGGSGGIIRLGACGPASTAPDGKHAVQLQGQLRAIGSQSTGGTVEIVASAAGVQFQGSSSSKTKQVAVIATGQSGADGLVTIIAAFDVTPSNPSTQPPATVLENTPTPTTCQCGELAITIDSPTSGEVTAEDSIDVRGTVSGASSVLVNGNPATVIGNTFVATGVLLNEGTNVITAAAQDDQNQFVSDSVSVRRDTEPPLVVIETPRDGDRLITSTIDVAGTVNDVIPGANVNEDDVSVTINGVPAPVHNRSFFLPGVPLALGPNTITAVAVDRVGNSDSTSIQVTREPDLAGVHLAISGGNAQQAPILTTLPIPLSALLTDNDGVPLQGRPIVFDVSRGDGLLGDPSENLRSRTFLTDASGLASVDFTIGSRTGQGFHRVRATTPGSLSSVEFCATAAALPAEKITIVLMTPRTWIAGQELTDPLTVIVTDMGGNPVSGIPVDFQVTAGGGHFRGPPALQVLSDLDGFARAFWTLGPDVGTANNEATASFAGNPGLPATFLVSGIAAGPIQATSLSGIVLNSALEPIVGARAVVRGTTLEAITGPDGRFMLNGLSPGSQRIGVLGSAANDPTRGLFFPDIDYAVQVISGIQNRFDQDIVLPFLDMPNAKVAGGNQDVILTMAGVPGFTIKVFANSTYLANGTQAPVLMTSSQVKFDKLPMPPPRGSTAQIVGTVQPPGVRFDPPAQVSYPNVEGLSPGDVADLFAFHHDIGQFVSIGPGTVTPDGSVVTSDPGFGLLESGWHCLIRIPGPAGNCAKVNNCTATWDWTSTTGASGSDLPVQFCVNNDAASPNKASVTVTFSPGGGSIDATPLWSIADPSIVESSGPLSNSTSITLNAKAAGATTITSPKYRFPDPAGGPDVTCQVVIDIKVLGPEINDLDKNFAPSVEKLDVRYSVLPAGSAAAAAKIEVFKTGDASNPIFKDETIPKTGSNVLFQWDGKANQGTGSGSFVSPKDSPFTVKVSISDAGSFVGDCFKKEDTTVEVESIGLTPSGSESLVKPTTAATEVDREIEALVKIKKKDGTGIETEIPVTIAWSFEDPDDTATNAGIDSNGATGGDNGPLANGGKRGAGSTLWKAVTGFTTTIAANGQTADSETNTSGADKGKTKITFSASALGGDNYILVAQCKDAGGTVLKEKKSGTWSVRKTVAYPNVYNMAGGLDAGAVMAVANIDPAFSGDGYTDYSLGAVHAVPVANSPQFVTPLLVPNATETPTAVELDDYLNGTPIQMAAAQVAIEARAQAWHDRNVASRVPTLTANAAAIGAAAPSVIGALYHGPKWDGDVTTGATAHYPAGITIITRIGAIDPDGEWEDIQGSTLGHPGIVYVWSNATDPPRLQIIGRHETGHVSDHVSFGPGDHSATGLMTPTGDSNMFSDDSILRLRGWLP